MDKLNPKIIIGVVVVVILLIVAAVLMYVFIPRVSAPAPPAPSEDDAPLKPLKSATVLATKTGVDNDKGVSGYSFKREYAEGTCTFTTAMNKYVTLTATLGIDTTDTRLRFVEKVKAIWKTGSIEMSVVEVTLNPPTTPASLVLNIPATTNTDINIACDGSGTARNDNTIEIYYSTQSTQRLWGTITMSQGLGNEITSAFDTIPPGKGTELAVTLVAAITSDITTTQSIPYKFTVKGTSPPQVINDIYLRVVNPNTYIMTMGDVPLTVKTRKNVLSSYADYVALQVESGSRQENIGDFISIPPSGTITYKKNPPDDTCFFKIEMASQDCQYVWQQHVPTTCSTACGPGFYMEKATGVLKQPTGDGAACRNLVEVPLRPGPNQCTSQPECPVDCILGTAPAGTVQLYEDITNTNTATCTAQGTISQMKVLIPSVGTGIKCASVYSSTPDKAPVTITGVSSPALECTLTIKSTSARTSSTAGVDILQGTTASVVWPGASGSRLEGINFNSTSTDASRTCTLKLWSEGASTASTIASISVPRFTTTTGRLCKVMLTNTGVLRFYTKPNLNTVSTWDAQSPIIFGTEGAVGVYTLRLVNYVRPGTTTPITKLEIVASDGVIKATYPQW